MINIFKQLGICFMLCILVLNAGAQQTIVAKRNPVITDKYPADPAAFVYGDSVYLYTGHDVAPRTKNNYEMHERLCYSSSDMVNWKAHPSPLNVKNFSGDKDDAWASQVIERDGKFYWYVSTEHATVPGKSIGVAVADNPRGPFKDDLGKALITNDMMLATKISWDDSTLV